MPIDALGFPVAKVVGSVAPAATATSSTGATPGFGESLHKLLEAVDNTDSAANNAVADMLTGTGDVHTAMIALQRAEQTLQLTVQMRNKLVQAYQDVMRMPI